MTTRITVQGSTATVQRTLTRVTVTVPLRVPNTGGGGGVSVPAGGWPASQLASGVRASLDRADTAVQSGDPRLSDARPPLAHTHPVADVSGAVATTDPRLSDARIPVAHLHPVSDVTGAVASTDPRLSDARTPVAHAHTAGQVSDSTPVGRAVLTAADGQAARTAIGAVSTTSWSQHLTESASALAGKADLVGGMVPSSQLPAIPTVQTMVVATSAQRLALTGVGAEDRVVQTGDPGRGTYFFTGADPADPASWTLAVAPSDAVSSVNGQSGAVVIGRADIGLAHVDDTADLSKPVSTAQGQAIATRAPLVHSHSVADVSGAVATTDPRLTDARTPTAHTHPVADVTGAVTSTDPRLSDARTPTAHVHAQSDVTGLAAALALLAPKADPVHTGTLTTPALKVTAGAGTAGQVLTSDATGTATWQTASGGGGTPGVAVKGIGAGTPSVVALADGTTSIGHGATSTSPSATAVGRDATSTQSNSTALGYGAYSSHANSTAIGPTSATTAANQIRLGRAAETVSIPGKLQIGDGALAATLTTRTNANSKTELVVTFATGAAIVIATQA